MTPDQISIVIPTLNEESNIAACIASAKASGATEVIVADGGSTDATWRTAESSGTTKLIRSLPGRGVQLNAGARFTKGEFILFLHADNRLSKDCLGQICKHPETTWGAFRQRIDSDRTVFRWLEAGNAARAKVKKMPFGDQGIFVRRSVFLSEGGFDEVPLMEDVILSKKLRRIAKPILLPGPLTISARRWEHNGVVRQTVRNWTIQLSHSLGVTPERLAKWYR
tara:strand:+ start:265475 stop:266146 length:672 start_codon:yes stop_codon:yes gene_type:complete